MAAQATCVHGAYDSPFYKRKLGYWPGVDRCELCFSYGVWEAHARVRRLDVPDVKPVPGFQLNKDSIGEGTSIRLRNHLTPNEASTGDRGSLTIKLESGQFGEAYHVLICRLLQNQKSSLGPKIHVDFKDGNERSIKEIKDLFDWYRNEPDPPSQDSTTKHAKKETSRLVAANFRAGNYDMYSHPQLFATINCTLLGLDSLGINEDSDLITSHTRLQPMYAAKYWLNRYFRLTQQFGPNNRVHIPLHICDRPHSYLGMPKIYEVGRLAVIHVRRTVESGSEIGRVMDEDNRTLIHIVKSIAEANRLCGLFPKNANLRPIRFTHLVVCLTEDRPHFQAMSGQSFFFGQKFLELFRETSVPPFFFVSRIG
jgi:hypothetical protein